MTCPDSVQLLGNDPHAVMYIIEGNTRPLTYE